VYHTVKVEVSDTRSGCDALMLISSNQSVGSFSAIIFFSLCPYAVKHLLLRHETLFNSTVSM